MLAEKDHSPSAYDRWWVEEINLKQGWVLHEAQAFEVKPNWILEKLAGCDHHIASQTSSDRATLKI